MRAPADGGGLDTLVEKNCTGARDGIAEFERRVEFGTHGYLAMRQKRQEIQKVRQELEKLDKENAELQQNVQDLKSDPETIRKIAREEYGLAGANEVIIKLPAQKPAAPPAAKP